jgi:hypothetical protein
MLFYRIAFWLPGVTAVSAFVLAWRSGILRRPPLLAAILALGLLFQSAGMLFTPMWAAGLVIQAGLAVILLVRLKLGA